LLRVPRSTLLPYTTLFRSSTTIATMMIATFGGGCFWCTETIFQRVDGVKVVSPGYMGGTRANPTYEQVCTGATGHAEVINIEYRSEEHTSELQSRENLVCR